MTTDIAAIQPQVETYLSRQDWRQTPGLDGVQLLVSPLAQGEYNLNYLLRAPQQSFVFRVNIGTQIDRSDQILYEYRALKLLAASGVTPKPYFVDDSRRLIDYGILIMAYLPGRHLDYHKDLALAADLFAVVHQTPVADRDNHLIREDRPLTLIFEECSTLLEAFFSSELADAEIKNYLRDLRDWAATARHRESAYQADPWPCIVNTEVNSGNFIVNPDRSSIHLVDWEMPRWGDPSGDLCHFCSPFTTLWKTNYRMPASEKQAFIQRYSDRISDRHLRDTLVDRMRLRAPFVLMRGISWSAMAWVAYQTRFAGVKNEDTWQTLQRYMNLDFIRSIFDSYLKQ